MNESTKFKHIHEESWDLPSSFDLYSTPKVHTILVCPTKEEDHIDPYKKHKVSSSSCTTSIDIECIEPTTPLDISNISLSSKEYDGSGHCVWAGAFLLIQCMNEILDIILPTCKNEEEKLRNKLQMIELGCGTGIGQLALMSAITTKFHLSVYGCFTDADPAVLNLCQRNCQLNNLSTDSYSIQEFTWGQDLTKNNVNTTAANIVSNTFDIVLATDVLYDIDMLHPLLSSASQLISSSSKNSSGLFILSHIRRACYNDNNPPEAMENLEKYIVDQGREHYGLSVYQVIRPPMPEKMSSHVLDFCSKEAFHGSAIFIFQKT
jgi:predicted nicotinamide N-methyase